MSADNRCIQLGSRSGLTKYWAWSGSKLFDSDCIPESFFFKKLILKKIAEYKKHAKLFKMQRAEDCLMYVLLFEP